MIVQRIIPTTICKFHYLNSRGLFELGSLHSLTGTILKISKRSKTRFLSNEILYGRSVCNVALQVSRRPIFRLHLLERWREILPTDSRIAAIMEVAADRKIPITYANRKMMDSMVANRPHQGVCLEVGELPFLGLAKELCKTTATLDGRNCIWVLLCGILDPMNLGAILRSCLYFNVGRVIVCGNCCPLTPVVSKASCGASEILHVHTTEEPLEMIYVLRNEQWDIIGTVAENHDFLNPENVRDVRLNNPSLIVFGSEGDGVPPEISNACTRIVTIRRQFNGNMDAASSLVESLNVSTASAIILHALSD